MIARPRSPKASRLALLALLALAAACYSSPDKRVLQYLNTEGFGKRYTGNAQQDDYLQIRDSLKWIDSYGTVPPGQGTVGIDGTIEFDVAGRVWVAGMTKEQVEVYLTEKAQAYYNSQVDLKVTLGTNTQNKRYWILGEVNGAGPRALKGDETLFEAVFTAGPKEHSANLGRVKLIKADPVDPLVITANLAQLPGSGDSTFQIIVEENDIIVVPPTMLAQLGYFISDLVYPFTTVFSEIFSSLFQLTKFNVLQNNPNNKLF